jgi:hypothetical protein
MIKQRITIEQLSVLQNDELLFLAEKCHISSSKDIDTDDRSLWEFRNFMKTQLSIGRLIQLLMDRKLDITWNSDSSTPTECLIVDGLMFRDVEFCDCLWYAVKYFVLGIE